MRVLLFIFCIGLHSTIHAMDTVRVQTVIQFFDSIQSDRLILIEPGVYDVTNHPLLQTLDQSRVYKDLQLGQNVRYSSEEGVTVYMVKNIRIEGLGSSPSATVFTSSFLGDEVLTLLGCEKIQLENIQLTHSADAPGAIKGGLLKISQSTDVSVKNCELIGRASVGLTSWRSKDIQVNTTLISACSYGIVDLRDSWTLRFETCTFKENKACQFFWLMSGCTDVQIRDSEFNENIKRGTRSCENSGLFSFTRCEMVLFENNSIKGNECDYMGDREVVRIVNSTNELKRNKFVNHSSN